MIRPRLTIIIVTWNSAQDIESCLTSLQQQGIDQQIIVVDNASTDGTAQLIKEQYPSIELIALSTNVGFAAGCNRGAAQARSPWLLLLNPDTIVPPNTLLNWFRWAQQQVKLGASGPKLLNANGSTQPSVRRFPSWGNMVTLMTKIHRLWPGLLSRYLAKDFAYNHESVVNQVMGAAILTPTVIYQRLGGLDERFYLWFEEVDYCYRLKQVGLDVWYNPQVSITHNGGQSFIQVDSGVKQRQFIKSLLYYSHKHFKFWQYLILIVLTPLSWLIFGLSLLVPTKILNQARREWYKNSF